MSKRRGEDIREYERRRYDAKKRKCKDKNREKLERYYMGKEDVNVVAAALAPPSSDSASPSSLYFPSSHMEDAREENVEPRYIEGDTLLLEANTKERGYVHPRFLFYFFFFHFTHSFPS